jgi:hypothetical protein
MWLLGSLLLSARFQPKVMEGLFVYKLTFYVEQPDGLWTTAGIKPIV